MHKFRRSNAFKFRRHHHHQICSTWRSAFRQKHKKNPVWEYYDHFDLTYHPDKRNFRCCLICRECGIDKAISVGKAASTGPLVSHLRRHTEQYMAFMEKKKDLDNAITSSVHGKTQLSMYTFATPKQSTNELFQMAFAQWVMERNLPLTVGQAEQFISMMQIANKQLTVPTYNKTYDIIVSKKIECMKKLAKYLKKRYFSITCDHWTSLAQDNYGALTLHLIENYDMKTFVLSCVTHDKGATAVEIESQLTTELQNWGLEKKFFFCAVTDTASNMNAFGERILQWDDAIYLRHHYCVDHVLQLTAVKAYNGEVRRDIFDLEEHEGEDNSVSVIKKARDIVTLFHSSSNAKEKLVSAQRDLNPASTPLQLLQDVKTRWWSTYALVERMIQLREVLIHIFSNEFRYRETQNTPTTLERLQLTPTDFEHLENIAYVLKPFKEAQQALEGEKYVTLSLVPLVIHHLKDELGICEAAINPDQQRDLSTLISTMKQDFDNRWGDTLQYSYNTIRTSRRRQKGIPTYAYWALVLDPRTKKKVKKILKEEEITEVWDDIRMAIVQLVQHMNGIEENIDEDMQQELPQEEEGKEEEQQPEKRRKVNFLEDGEDDMGSMQEHPITIDQQIRTEIEAFKSERGQPMYTNDQYSNPLQWWRGHVEKYPNIWKLASIILAIPATSAPSERVFSTAANIINKKRVRLKPETLDALIFLRGNKEFVTWN